METSDNRAKHWPSESRLRVLVKLGGPHVDILQEAADDLERTKKRLAVVEARLSGKVPCPTCGKTGRFDEFRGSAVEKIVWNNYPAPYESLRP